MLPRARPAATCAICHMSGFGEAGTTHDVGERLTWYLFAPVSERRPAWESNAVRMQKVCLECHNENFIENFYTDGDAATEQVNAWVRESQAIQAVPYALSLRPGAIIGPAPNGTAGITALSASGTVTDIHPGGSYYSAGGEFAGPNGVIGAASSDSTSGYGVIGIAQGTQGRGVYGRSDSASGYAGYFENTATVLPPVGITDLNMGNNSATIGRYQVTLMLVFRDYSAP